MTDPRPRNSWRSRWKLGAILFLATAPIAASMVLFGPGLWLVQWEYVVAAFGGPAPVEPWVVIRPDARANASHAELPVDSLLSSRHTANELAAVRHGLMLILADATPMRDGDPAGFVVTPRLNDAGRRMLLEFHEYSLWSAELDKAIAESPGDILLQADWLANYPRYLRYVRTPTGQVIVPRRLEHPVAAPVDDGSAGQLWPLLLQASRVLDEHTASGTYPSYSLVLVRTGAGRRKSARGSDRSRFESWSVPARS